VEEELLRANGRSPIIMNNAALKTIAEEYALEWKNTVVHSCKPARLCYYSPALTPLWFCESDQRMQLLSLGKHNGGYYFG